MTGSHHFLPKSEYRLCETPERWVDVTESCEACDREGIGDQFVLRLKGEIVLYTNPCAPFRLRKIRYTASPTEHGWAFIVERREP